MTNWLAILACLAAVESGQRDEARGALGERGRYQFLASAWSDACRLLGCRHAWSRAHEASVAHAHALALLGQHQQRLRGALGREPAFEQLYAVWNLGYAGFARRDWRLEHCPRSTRAAASRFTFLIQAGKLSPAPTVRRENALAHMSAWACLMSTASGRQRAKRRCECRRRATGCAAYPLRGTLRLG